MNVFKTDNVVHRNASSRRLSCKVIKPIRWRDVTEVIVLDFRRRCALIVRNRA